MALRDCMKELEHFQQLSSHPSMDEGAEFIGVSHEELSKEIGTLEAILKIELFVRQRDRLILTSAGEVVLNAAKKIFNDVRELEESLKSFKFEYVEWT